MAQIKAKFSPSTSGIYPVDAYKEFPSDAIDIPNALYAKFQNGEISGVTIVNGAIVKIPDAPSSDPRALIEVTAFQAHAAIARSGLYDAVESIMQSEATPLETKLAWNKAQSFKRLSPTVLAMSAALGLTDKQIDDLFALAATIEA